MNVFYKLKDTALKGIEKAVDGVDKTRDLVNKQNQQTKERFEDLKDRVSDVKLGVKMGMMGAKHAADDAVDLIQIINPLAFRRAESSADLDEEAEVSEEVVREKKRLADEKRARQVARVQNALGSIPIGFYEPPGQFDSLRATLEAMPHDLTEELLSQEAERLMEVVSILSSELSAKVLEHYEDMVGGINQVSDIMNRLQMSMIVAKNARRTLARANSEVESAISVSKSVVKKTNLLEALSILSGLKGILNLDQTLRAQLEGGDCVGAVLTYADAHLQLVEYSELAVAAPIRDGMAGLLWEVVQKVETSLQAVVGNFDPALYRPVFQAYILLGEEIKPLGDKIQESLLHAVEGETEAILRKMTEENVAEAAAKMAKAAAEGKEAAAAAANRRLGYKDLTKFLQKDRFQAVFGRTLEILFDILASVHRMHTWHSHRAVELQAARALKGGASGDASSGSMEEGSNATLKSPSKHHRHRSMDREAYAFSMMAAGELEACQQVSAALERCRRAIWEMAATRVAALLTSPAAPEAPNLLRLLGIARRFATAGEAFSGVEATALRQHIARAGDAYFASLQKQRLGVLQARLAREGWKPVGPDVAPSLRRALASAAACVTNGSDGPAASLAASAAAAASGDSTPFAAYVASGNAFKGADRGTGPAWAAAEAEEADQTSAAAAAGDDEEESAELLQDSIDEMDDTPGKHRKHQAAAASAVGPASAAARAGGTGLAGPKPVVTESSQVMLKMLVDYLRLMRLLQGSTPQVFAGLAQLYEAMFVHVFRVFGQKSALDGSAQAAEALTPRLRNTLLRLVGAPTSGLDPAALAAKVRDAFSMPMGAGSGHEAASLTSSGNMFGLMQRAVAMEALSCVAEELKRLRPVFKAVLSQADGQRMEHFFTHTVDAVQDLGEHVYRAVARLLLNVSWVPEAVGDSDKVSDKFSLASGKYDLKEVQMEQNHWADQLVAEYKTFGAKIACCDLSPEALTIMWENAALASAEAITNGLARVRKCSLEGRALMSLDVQVVIGGLKKMAPHPAYPKLDTAMRSVDTFIKAFYLPEGELLHWSQTHPEYTPAQIVALINQISYAFKWGRNQAKDMITKIEAGAM